VTFTAGNVSGNYVDVDGKAVTIDKATALTLAPWSYRLLSRAR
jgi:hypothetical protein